MALRRGFSQVRQRSKRSTAWAQGPGSGTALTSLTSSVLKILGSGVTPTIAKVTIVRLRGQFGGSLLTATAAGNGFIGALGVGIVTVPAFAIGTTAVPDPVDEADWDGWMFHRFFQLTAASPISGGAATDELSGDFNTASFNIEVDSKAMRKIDENEILMAAVGVTEIGTATADLRFDSRLLAMLG